jgi:hypothetical protein
MPRLPRPHSDRLIEILNGAVFVATLLGGGLIAIIGEKHVVLVVLVGLFLALLYTYLTWSRLHNDYDFADDSKELAEFFTHWYQRKGNHTVFCDDLDWMDGVDNASIRSALKARGANATVCLRSSGGSVARGLAESGVVLKTIPEALTTHAKFSIFQSDGLTEMIIRIKAPNYDRIRFRRTRDDIFIKLAQDLITNNCQSE